MDSRIITRINAIDTDDHCAVTYIHPRFRSGGRGLGREDEDNIVVRDCYKTNWSSSDNAMNAKRLRATNPLDYREKTAQGPGSILGRLKVVRINRSVPSS